MRFILSTVLIVATHAAAAQDGGLRLAISFDDTSLAKLQDIGERVTINAWFFGEPTDAGADLADEMGTVYLGTETYDIWPADQVVTIGGSVPGMPKHLIIQPMVNVNVYTSRIKDDNNLLNCGLVEGPFDDLAKDTQAISCTLIGG